MSTNTLTYQLVAILLAVIAGTTFLGYNHDLSEQVVSGIYTAVLSGVLVGHFTSKGGTNA